MTYQRVARTHTPTSKVLRRKHKKQHGQDESGAHHLLTQAPHTLKPDQVMQLQREYGNQFVQRWMGQTPTQVAPQGVVQRNGGEIPKTDHLPAMTQTLLDGALQKNTIDEAVRQIYDNMFTKTGWKYNASIVNVNGKSYVTGTTDVGMCESYSEAFMEALRQYDLLRAQHPTDAVKTGKLEYKKDNHLGNVRFYTNAGLTLMGATALKGNVYQEVDGAGKVVGNDVDAINRFVFRGHWYINVNGVDYDPIFRSIGQDNVGGQLDIKYKGDGYQFIADQTNPVGTGEFGAQFVWINDLATFESNLNDLVQFYDDRSDKIEALLSGGFGDRVKSGVFKGSIDPAKATLIGKLRTLLTNKGINFAGEFLPLIEKSYTVGNVNRDQVTKLRKLQQLLQL